MSKQQKATAVRIYREEWNAAVQKLDASRMEVLARIIAKNKGWK